jgi:TPR repeat protein
MYLTGKGVTQSNDQAIEWYRKGAELGGTATASREVDNEARRSGHHPARSVRYDWGAIADVDD